MVDFVVYPRRQPAASSLSLIGHAQGVGSSDDIDHASLVAGAAPAPVPWDTFVRGALVDRWLHAYEAMTPWEPNVMEIALGELVYLFDGAPTLDCVGPVGSADRVVAVWGCSAAPADERDRPRMRGFVPNSERWSGAGRDRGHFVAHGAGGGMDLNLFPQSAVLNRGRSAAGRRWRRMERYAAEHPGTPLLVRPIYETAGWEPSALDFGLLVDNEFWWERFANDG